MPSFLDAHGVPITTHEWRIDAPRAVVQISHGLGEHARRYDALAADLNAAGYTVVAEDHRGHGETGTAQWANEPASMGKPGPGGLQAMVQGVHQFSGLVRTEYPGLPLVLLGHSLGSLMAQITLNSHAADYDGVVLSGSAYRALGWMDAGDLNRKHASLGTTGAEWLSRDPSIAEAWVADPLTFPAESMKLFGVRGALQLLGKPAKGLPANLPLLLQVGSDDTLGGERSVRRLARAYQERSGLRDVTVQVYEGARHEIYNETNRDEVIADLVAWLDQHVGSTAADARRI